MIGMIFAAGLGTRLRPLTDNCPKALIEVGGVPMIEHTLRHMADAGIRKVVVNVHHHARMLVDYLKNRTSDGLRIEISDETERLLDTGGGIAKAAPLLTGQGGVLVHNADILTDLNLTEMCGRFDRNPSDALLLVSDRKSSRGLLFDDRQTMKGWINHSSGATRPALTDSELSALTVKAFGGIHVVSDATVDAISGFRPAGEPFSIIDFYVDRCRQSVFMAYTPDAAFSWFDIGKHDTLAAARDYCRRHL